MAKIGADIPQMQSLERTFKAQKDAAATLTSTLDSASNGSAAFWEGPAADSFRNAWVTQFKPALDKLHAALQEAETEVMKRWQAIEQAGS